MDPGRERQALRLPAGQHLAPTGARRHRLCLAPILPDAKALRTARGLARCAFLAITPVSVAIDRSNNTDSCLVLVLLLSAWAFVHAVERGSMAWLLASLALVGIGFNVKMLAAVVVVPALVVVYAIGAPVSLRRRALDLAAAGLVLVVVSLSWIVLYDLTPPAGRPFAGSSKTNSMMELSVGHNGVERFVRRNRPPGGAVTNLGGSQSQAPGTQPDTGSSAPLPAGGDDRGRGMPIDRVPAGPLRLVDRQLAGQVAWLLPLAVAGFVFGASWTGFRARPTSEQYELLLWAGWALCYGAVYSSAGGIFHEYRMRRLVEEKRRAKAARKGRDHRGQITPADRRDQVMIRRQSA